MKEPGNEVVLNGGVVLGVNPHEMSRHAPTRSHQPRSQGFYGFGGGEVRSKLLLARVTMFNATCAKKYLRFQIYRATPGRSGPRVILRIITSYCRSRAVLKISEISFLKLPVERPRELSGCFEGLRFSFFPYKATGSNESGRSSKAQRRPPG